MFVILGIAAFFGFFFYMRMLDDSTFTSYTCIDVDLVDYQLGEGILPIHARVDFTVVECKWAPGWFPKTHRLQRVETYYRHDSKDPAYPFMWFSHTGQNISKENSGISCTLTSEMVRYNERQIAKKRAGMIDALEFQRLMGEKRRGKDTMLQG